MYEYIARSKESKNRVMVNSVTQKKNNVKKGIGFVDNRPEAILQRKIVTEMNNQQVIQCVKKYNHGRKLYVNDEDDEPAPAGYTTVSKFFHNMDDPEWTGEREPSRYYVGAGGLGSASSFLSSEIHDHGRHPSMSVTTLDSRLQAQSRHPEYEDNRWELEQMGASVRTDVDATDPGSMSPTRYDEVHFEFPHTGVYGASGNESQNTRSRNSNEQLMRGSMQALGAKKLRPGGLLRISEGGFPYRDSGGRTGMDLDGLATQQGYSVEPGSPLGNRTIGRTGGNTVTLPNSTRHNYRAPSGPVPELVDYLLARSTHWLEKRAIVQKNPELIWWVDYLGHTEQARLLQQYLEMDDSELEPGVLTAYFGNNDKDDKDDRDPPGMGGGMLTSALATGDHPIF